MEDIQLFNQRLKHLFGVHLKWLLAGGDYPQQYAVGGAHRLKAIMKNAFSFNQANHRTILNVI